MFSHIHPENYPSQLAEKQQQMASMFADFSLPEVQVFESDPLHYRLRVEFRVWHDGDDLNYIMFNSETKERFTVKQFPPASEVISKAMPAVIDYVKDKPILRQKLFQVDFLSTLSGELLISLLYHKQLDEKWQQSATKLKHILSNIAPTDLIGRARKQTIVLDKNYVTEILTIQDKKYKYQQIENSFTQPNGIVNQHMLSWAKTATKDRGGDLIELYCGNGNFSLALSDNFNRVLGTEISKTSVNSALLNIKMNNINNVDIVRMSSEEFTQAVNAERTFRRLAGFDLTSYQFDTVLVDPPRAGLDLESVELVRRFEMIIYISCNPETLKTNLTSLTTTHTIEQFALFDQFPYTHHIEAGVILKRK